MGYHTHNLRDLRKTIDGELINDRFVFRVLHNLYGINLKSVIKFYKFLRFSTILHAKHSLNLPTSLKSRLADIIRSRKELGLPDFSTYIRISRRSLVRYKISRSYRGLRHRQSLPVRGQRTKTNSRTQRRIKR